MEAGRRKVRIYLLCVVTAAVLAGLIYYFTEIYHKTNVIGGTLVHLEIEHEEL